MSSTSPSDDTPSEPLLFQTPRPGPGRPPSQTSTSEPRPSSTPETSPSDPAESSTSPEQDWSTSGRPAGDEQQPSDTSSGSLGSEVGAEARAGLRGSIAAGIVNATEAAHNTLADDVGRHLGQFLASDKEIQEVSDAGARIISRKLPKGTGNPDLEDLLRLGVAVAAYVGRQVRIFRQASAARRQLRAAAAGQTASDQPA